MTIMDYNNTVKIYTYFIHVIHISTCICILTYLLTAIKIYRNILQTVILKLRLKITCTYLHHYYYHIVLSHCSLYFVLWRGLVFVVC